jgi:hypothetical protein
VRYRCCRQGQIQVPSPQLRKSMSGLECIAEYIPFFSNVVPLAKPSVAPLVYDT